VPDLWAGKKGFVDIRVDNNKGFQPVRLDTTTRIKAFGWKEFEQVDSPEDLADYLARKAQFKKEL
jgi:hypothetical protein